MSEQPTGAMKIIRRVFPKTPNFFGLLEAQSAVSVQSLEHLVAYMEAGDPGTGLEVKMLERQANVLKEQSMEALNSAFSTPMDREELFRAIATLHRIATYAHTTVREMEVLRVKPDAWTLGMARLLHEGAIALDEGYGLLEKDPAAAEAKADRARISERRVEKQYRLALAELFAVDRDIERIEAMRIAEVPGRSGGAAYELIMDVFKHREVYRHLSNAGDRVARAGDTLHDIVVKLV